LSTKIELLLPENDETNPQVSIVIPALNEQINIKEFIEWCQEGFRRASVRGEILIVDSSTDNTPYLAQKAGARVLKVPRRGLGRAYSDALPFVRSDFIIMGDADCTYDFRQIDVFVQAYQDGAQFVMGSRWKGSIEKGSMPPHHQYLGTPITTWILNRVYSSKFSDIHCGMRGITKNALQQMQLQSQSWEYASEMVLKSVHMKLRTIEVPVHFLRDRNGRVSHHKREGWWSPFSAAWANLRTMFIYGSDFFTLVPGIILLVIGSVLCLPATFGTYSVGPISISIFWQLLGLTTMTLGLTGVLSAAIVRVLFDYSGSESKRWLSLLRYTRTSVLSIVLFLSGIGLNIPLIRRYLSSDYSLPESTSSQTHLAVTGLSLMICSVILFVFTLMIHASFLATRFKPKED